MNLEIEYRQVEADKGAFTILSTLLKAAGTFVSGSVLASKLGISRPAVWAKLEKLRGQGFEFEAVRNRGYRINKQPEVLQPALLRYESAAIGCDIETLYFPVIDSTNSEAERQTSYGRNSPFAIASSCQTKGRGRLGREWHSASAENLYLSVLFEPNIPPQQLQHFTLWAGIYICRALQHFVPKSKLQIKWPNDLHCQGRKFAGMLTEAKMDADSLRSIVFGIGINVNSNPNQYPDSLRQIATSLQAVQGEELPINQITAQVIQAVHCAYKTSIHADSQERLVDAWSPLSSLCGQAVTAVVAGQEIQGIASGIDESGALRLKTANGNLQIVRAGDVTLKK